MRDLQLVRIVGLLGLFLGPSKRRPPLHQSPFCRGPEDKASEVNDESIPRMHLGRVSPSMLSARENRGVARLYCSV